MSNEALRKTMIALAVILLIVFVYMIIRGSNGVTEREVTREEHVVEIIAPITNSVVYDGEGFSPAQIQASIDTIIEFTNSGSSSLTIEFEGRPELKVSEIPAGGTSSSMPLSEVGTYEFINANDPSQSGTIEIN